MIMGYLFSLVVNLGSKKFVMNFISFLCSYAHEPLGEM
jgi:hypothetical protein